MKVFISSDIEGTAGVVDWDQVRPGNPGYERSVKLLTAEINAAIDGAMTAGATDFVVNDSHSTMQNLDPAALAGRAGYISGRYKPLYMMQGLDPSFDAVFFISYHGAIGGPASTLSHTYNPSVFHDVSLNGATAGEASINALVALAHGVPVALVTGDDVTAAQARTHLPHAEAVVVKTSLSRHAAASLHPEAACNKVARGAARALRNLDRTRLPAISLPATIAITCLTPDHAELAEAVAGVERTGDRSVTLTDDDPLALYRRFVAVIYITRWLPGV